MSAVLVNIQERRILAEAFSAFADRIKSVGVFGSRATGLSRENSDIDLVVYGDLDEKSERRLWTMLEDSSLPVSVDLVVYARINNPLLKDHIDAVGTELFTQEDLQRAASRAP
jgi:predicted nucleotidyltransferase